jgi:hypothetical protein
MIDDMFADGLVDRSTWKTTDQWQTYKEFMISKGYSKDSAKKYERMLRQAFSEAKVINLFHSLFDS